MASGVVYEGVQRQPEEEWQHDAVADSKPQQLFSGLKLWFSYAIPQREWLMQNAKANGAEIVKLEKQADVRLVDHARKNQAPGTHSYRFVEQSIRNGTLEDLDSHRVGVPARVDRPVGSVVTGPKGTRNAYTEEEDQWLYNIMKPFEKSGGHVRGNEIYKQIESLRPRHTFQSWRDRYIKRVMDSNRIITANVNHLDGDVAEQTTAQPDSRPQGSTAAPEGATADTESPRKRQKLMNGATSTAGQADRAQTPVSPRRHVVAGPRTPSRPHLPASPRVTVEAPLRSPTRLKPSEPEPQKHSRHRPAPTPRKEGAPSSSDAVEQTTDGRPATPQRQHRRMSSELWTPDSQRKEPLTPTHERIPIRIPPFSFGRFGRKHLKKMIRLTAHALVFSGDEIASGFDGLAADYSELGHTGHEWRVCWQLHALPVWLERNGQTLEDIEQSLLLPLDEANATPLSVNIETQGKDNPEDVEGGRATEVQHQVLQETRVEEEDQEFEEAVCTHCFTKESSTWRLDKKRRLLCAGCWALMREGRMRSMSGNAALIAESFGDRLNNHSDQPGSHLPTPTATTSARPQHRVEYSDAYAQTSPLRSPSPDPPQNMRNEQEFREEAVDVLSHPTPNESRKRSAGRSSQSASQETKMSSKEAESSQGGIDGTDERAAAAHSSVRDVDAITEDISQGQQSLPVDVLEIPSTPEQAAADGELESDLDELDRPPLKELRPSSRESSPLFMPQDGEEPELPPSSTSPRRPPTSPLNIRLVNVRAMGADVVDSDKENDEPSSEAGYEFETAPNLSQDWDTAPEEPRPARASASTHALFETAEADADTSLLDLPEPEEGWDALGIPMPTSDEMNGVEAAPAIDDETANDERPETIVISSSESEEPDIDTWFAQQRILHKNTRGLDHMLSTAIQATCMDYDIAAQIVVRMVEFSKTQVGRRMGREGGIPPPNDVAGCWTEQDDNLLYSEVEEEQQEVLKKHGRERCEERWEWLGNYSEL